MLKYVADVDCHAPGQDTVVQVIIKLKIHHNIVGMSLYASQRCIQNTNMLATDVKLDSTVALLDRTLLFRGLKFTMI